MQGFFAVMKTECFAVQGELMMDELMKQIVKPNEINI